MKNIIAACIGQQLTGITHQQAAHIMFIAKHTVVLRYSFEIKTVVGRFLACSVSSDIGSFAYLLNAVNYTRFAIHLFKP